MLHPRQHHQVLAYPRRDHRHGEGGGGVQGPWPWGPAAEQTAGQGPGRRRRQRYDTTVGTRLGSLEFLWKHSNFLSIGNIVNEQGMQL